MKSLNNFIAGSSTPSQSGATSEIINPSTGTAYATAQLSSAADVDQALNAAAAAFVEWRETTPAERQRALLKIADALESRADEIVAIESENTGKPIGLTLSEEMPPMIDEIRFFAGAARHLEGKSAGEYMRGMTSFIRREPIGVCAQVTPWNYPMMMAVWKWAPAIAAGNTVVLKPSDTTPASTIFMAEVMSEFLPTGVFNVVTGDRDTGRLLVEHKIPAMVSITGSTRAGIAVAKAAADTVKRVAQELGGQAGHLGFGITHGGGTIAVDRAEVALPVNERVAHRKILGHLDQGLVDGGIAVRVVAAHGVADHDRGLADFGLVGQALLRVEVIGEQAGPAAAQPGPRGWHWHPQPWHSR